MKKILSVALLVLLLISNLSLVSCLSKIINPPKEEQELEFSFRLNDDGESYTLTGSLWGTTWDATWEPQDYTVKLPGTHEGLPVTAIADEAFMRTKCGRKIIIPASIQRIGDRAFEDCSLISAIEFEENSQLTSIGDYAFSGCQYLEKIEIPASVTNIGEYAFECVRLISVEFEPNSQLKTIRKFSFHGTAITSVVIPDSVTNIEAMAFEACFSLKNVEFSELLTTIGDYAFAFCESLESIDIPSSVVEIGEHAFYRCASLKSIKIPASVTNIGNYAFAKSSSLITISVDENNPNYKTIDGNLYSKDETTLMLYATGQKDKEFTVPDHVITISDGAFARAKYLESIIIPESVIAIDDSGYISKDYTQKYCGAFENCTALVRVEIKGATDTIGDQAFAGCVNLSEVHIGKNVDRIGYKAFINCPSLSSIYYYGAEAEWENVDKGDEWCDTPDTLKINYLN